MNALFGLEVPIVQAPMAGASDIELAIAVAGEGALGSLPCAMLAPDQIRAAVARFRAARRAPLNLNFFCHLPAEPDPEREARWLARLAPYYKEYDLEPAFPGASGPVRAAFDDTTCALIEELRPEVVSFHFGLPAPELLERVRSTGAKVICSATTVQEALWLEGRGCDAVIAQGLEAGGHRGMFLTSDPGTQTGTLALLPQVADAVRIPVIAAGGIADARGLSAALALGAAAVQMGTAYLRCAECATSPVHRRALAAVKQGETVMTNVFTGRPARSIVNRVVRELGPMSDAVPAFPRAVPALAPLRAQAEARGSGDFSPLYAGQAAALAPEGSAAELTRGLALALRR